MRAYAALLLLPLIQACSDSSSSEQGPSFGGGTSTPDLNTQFNRSLLLSDVTDKVLVTTIEAFEQQAQAQVAAVSSMCEAIVSNSSDVSALTESAQQDWRSTMDQWQQLEVMQIGPVLTNEANLRNKIYSWPVVQSCAVDQDVGFF